jgi:hypothetical protein
MPGRLVMHSCFGVMRALNRNVERVFTDRKETHWGEAQAEEGPANLRQHKPTRRRS